VRWTLWSSQRFDRALEDARAIKSGSAPFAGVPTLIKDLGTPEAGEPSYMGNRVLKALGTKAPVDAHIVTKMKAAGLISIGRTNVPEMACGNCPWACENEAFGDTHKPWNLAHTATGASAAAVAAGIVPIAHANDGGGSTRVPASANGLVGLKPSRGRISWGPMIGESWAGASVQGLLTKTVRDTALGLDLVSGPMPGDPYSLPQPTRGFSEELSRSPGRLRIGLCRVNELSPLHPDCVAAVDSVARCLAAEGHYVEEAYPETQFDESGYAGYFRIIAVGTVATVRAIERIAGRSLTEADMEPGSWVSYQMGLPVTGAEYAEAHAHMNLFTRRYAAWWEGGNGYDLLLSPTMATPPPKLGFLISEPADRVIRSRDTFPFTMQCNVTGQPAISLPLAMSRDGLPVGVQLAARYGDEAMLLRIAAQLEQLMPWHQRKPTGIE